MTPTGLLLDTVIPTTTLLLTDVINSGSFATVYQAHDIAACGHSDRSSRRSSSNYYAVKALEKTGLSKQQSDGLWREIGIMKRLKTEGVPNVVRLEKVVETGDWIFLVMECCEVDLYDAITQETLPQHTILPIFHSLCTTLGRLHALSIYHRDIKPENILLTHGSRRVRLADFGLSTIYPTSSDMGCGSTRYMAPECLPGNTEPYDCAKADAWSLGIVLVNLVSGKNPWYEADRSDPLYAAYLDGEDVLRETFGFSAEFDAVVRMILNPDPVCRLPVSEIWTKVKGVRQFYDEPTTATTPPPQQQQMPIPTSPIRAPPPPPPSQDDLFTASPPRYIAGGKFSIQDSGFESEEALELFALRELVI
ncbi:hypothetical protein HDU86_006621 [Geranomyces michiganensis]|nr:hypothetical protein HDU86_006621 [Geranomyces michiganensis]